MRFEEQYFTQFKFTKEQVKKNLKNALKDFTIARKDEFLEVKFNYAYTAFIKAGIALLSFHGVKLKSMPGHHAKLIEKMTEILGDNTVAEIGNLMRSKRNFDLYGGGIDVTEKECRECLAFVDGVLKAVKNMLSG